MISMKSNLGRHVPSGMTEEEEHRNEFAARKALYDAGQAVVIPLDHPAVTGGFRAIIEGFAETEYGPRRKRVGG